VRVERGAPTPEELVAVVLALSTVDTDRVTDRPLWTDVGPLVHAPLMPGLGAWRASGLPLGG
jgi:hypothetical protein